VSLVKPSRCSFGISSWKWQRFVAPHPFLLDKASKRRLEQVPNRSLVLRSDMQERAGPQHVVPGSAVVVNDERRPPVSARQMSACRPW